MCPYPVSGISHISNRPSLALQKPSAYFEELDNFRVVLFRGQAPHGHLFTTSIFIRMTKNSNTNLDKIFQGEVSFKPFVELLE